MLDGLKIISKGAYVRTFTLAFVDSLKAVYAADPSLQYTVPLEAQPFAKLLTLTEEAVEPI